MATGDPFDSDQVVMDEARRRWAEEHSQYSEVDRRMMAAREHQQAAQINALRKEIDRLQQEVIMYVTQQTPSQHFTLQREHRELSQLRTHLEAVTMDRDKWQATSKQQAKEIDDYRRTAQRLLVELPHEVMQNVVDGTELREIANYIATCRGLLEHGELAETARAANRRASESEIALESARERCTCGAVEAEVKGTAKLFGRLEGTVEAGFKPNNDDTFNVVISGKPGSIIPATATGVMIAQQQFNQQQALAAQALSQQMNQQMRGQWEAVRVASPKLVVESELEPGWYERLRDWFIRKAGGMAGF